MQGMTVLKAAAACCGRLVGENGDAGLGRIVIDSREIAKGDLFAAYKGERTDGHEYIGAALRAGAACCLAERIPQDAGGPVILVDDVQRAIEDIACAYRDGLSLPVIGVTGSVGKTSAKEMISSVLSTRLSVLKTDKNLNNQIGVPMTVSRIEPVHQAAVIEMGLSGFGEMSALARIVRPDIAVFTLIGHAHLEFLHDLNGVLRAKTEMLEYVPDDGCVIMNGDDELLAGFKCRQRKLSFGTGENCDVRATDIRSSVENGTDCVITAFGRRIEAHIPAYGRHLVYATLEGAAVGILMGLTDEEISHGISRFETVGRRAAIVKTDYLTLIDDCYNANPDSIKSSIDTLMDMPGRHVCVLGDMLELGDSAEELHRAVGEYAKDKGVELIFTCGPLAEKIADGAGGRAEHFPGREQLLMRLREELRRGDCILVKASRGMHFELVSDALRELGNVR